MEIIEIVIMTNQVKLRNDIYLIIKDKKDRKWLITLTFEIWLLIKPLRAHSEKHTEKSSPSRDL